MSNVRKAVLVCALAAVALVAAGAAGADASYTDPTGDSAGAPDITGVTIANDASGNLTWTVRTSQASLAADAMLDLEINADQNWSTGDDGIEYAFVIDSTGWALLRWNGSDYDDAPASSGNASYSNGVATFKVNKADLGVNTAFTFYVDALQFGPDDKVLTYDTAPDGDAVYDYTLTVPTPTPVAVTLQASKPVATPKKPAAGKPFVVGMAVLRGDTGAPLASGTVSCAVKVGGKALKATGAVRGGVAASSMRIPAKTKGKKVSGTIKVTFKGASASRSFAYTVA
jgi:hypothetical protein